MAKTLKCATVQLKVLIAVEEGAGRARAAREGFAQAVSDITDNQIVLMPIDGRRPILPLGWTLDAIPFGEDNDKTVGEYLAEMKADAQAQQRQEEAPDVDDEEDEAAKP